MTLVTLLELRDIYILITSHYIKTNKCKEKTLPFPSTVKLQRPIRDIRPKDYKSSSLNQNVL